MPILTKLTPTKGSPSTFSLDKSLLVALINDTYFQNINNWNKVILKYESSVGGQKEKVIFDASQATPEGIFLISDKARDVFEIKEVVIYDFDGGYYSINRTSLTTSEFDIDLSAALEGVLLISQIGTSSGELLSITNVNGQKVGQSFTPENNFDLTKIEVILNKIGSPVNAVLQMGVRAFSAYYETDINGPWHYADNTINSDTMVGSSVCEFNFSGLSLSQGVEYYFFVKVISADTINSSDRIGLPGARYQYAGGQIQSSDVPPNGVLATYDAAFTVHGVVL